MRSTWAAAAAIVGEKRVTIEPGVDINRDTLILLTPRANLRTRSFWVTEADQTDSFTIHMSSPRGSETEFAWLMVERG